MDDDFTDGFFNDPFMDPFQHMRRNTNLNSLENGHKHHNRHHNENELMNMNNMHGIFENFNKQMNDMQKMLSSNFANIPNDGACHIQSYSYSEINDGKNQPQITEKSYTHTRNGNISQTQATLRDSKDKIEKMRLQRKLGNQSRTITKQRINGGEINEDEHLENLDQNNLNDFNMHWNNEANQKLKPLIDSAPKLGRMNRNNQALGNGHKTNNPIKYIDVDDDRSVNSHLSGYSTRSGNSSVRSNLRSDSNSVNSYKTNSTMGRTRKYH